MGRSEGGLAVVTMQQNHHTSSSGSVSGPGNVDSKNNKQNSCARVGSDEEPNDNFPVGMRVLVVDDDPICLLLLESLLRRCQYKVTTCGQARTALNLLREKKDSFDLVISDVYMPDMDGFKLLELVGLEMDLPVIMMSANGETSVVMKGITHGACDYLIKPVRLEELKNIWQHVIRKKRTEANNKDIHVSSSQGEGAGRNTRAADDVENGSGLNEGTERSGSKTSRKRKDQEDDEEEDENDHESEDPSTLKKPRVVWSVDLHQQFVSAVNTLGIDKAVPKRILELMNVQGLTRENVASHLQKYRLYLKRLSGVASQQGGMANAFCGRESSFGALAPVEGFSDLQVLAQSGQLSAHPLASLQAGALGRLNGSVGIGMPGMNSSGVIQYSNIPNFSTNPPVVRSPRSAVAINNPSNMLSCLAPGSELSQLQHKQMSRPGDMSSSVEDPTRFLSMQQQLSPTSNIPLAMARGGNGNVPVNPANNALLMQLMQQQSRGLGNLSAERSLNQRANPSDGNLVVSSSLSTNGLNANWVSSPSMSGVTANSQPGNCLPTNASNVECKPTEVPAASSNSGMAPGSHNLGPRRDIGHPSMASIGDLCDLVSLDGRRVNIPPFSHGSANTRHDMGHGLKQDWQNQNPDFRSINNSMLNNQLSQATGLVNQRAVEPYIAHSQGQSPGFCNSNLNVDVKPSVNPMAPVFGGQCDNEQSTADSGLKIKEEYSMNLFKAGGVLFSEECNTDELMSILYKQQQEGIGYSDCDSALDAFPLKTCI